MRVPCCAVPPLLPLHTGEAWQDSVYLINLVAAGIVAYEGRFQQERASQSKLCSRLAQVLTHPSRKTLVLCDYRTVRRPATHQASASCGVLQQLGLRPPPCCS